MPSAGLPVPAPRRRRGLLTAAVAAIALGVIGAAAAGFAAGRGTAPMAAPVTTTVTADPQHVAFTAADSTWCREYLATTNRLIDAGDAAGAPRSMAASDLPATAWSPEDAATNRLLAEWSNRWDKERSRLLETVSNPTLKMLINGSLAADTELATKISDGTYVPGDFALFRSVTATDNALGAICDRI
ncbi:hypothetical protein A5768_11395 [Mycolicibacterium fortuitum]|uniref:hypothetical protein n=1 Tax=Mycolicibacterium fortuitum TaxID=1766 RepID=UPI0007EA2BD3|nr:hypothetical protein [Mycolicibacterium fortuitum]OBG11816.1 hypothetical protein A5768_11395 [Mycolicibacterium fortuitum]